MYQQRATTFAKIRFPLSVYIPLLLALTAVTPILITVGSIEIFLRPALIDQVSADMERDAQTRVQLINAYLSERLNDIKTLSQSIPVKSLLAGDQNSKAMAQDVLFTTQHRDVANYISLSLLNGRGNVVLSYPTAPLPHGKYLVLPGTLQQLQQSGKVLISDVFYDQTGNNASVDIYAHVVDNNYHLLGIVRASLGLHRIWEPVDSDAQVNGTDSYACILDQNGIRIAYSNSDRSGFTHSPYLFKAIAPIPLALQQRIADEDLYGNSSKQVSPVADQKLLDIQRNHQLPMLFQIDPVGQNQTFEAARYSSTVVPWTYFVFKPFNAVTNIADQQLLSTILVVVLLLILAIVVGLITGRRITLPILHAVTGLRKNSQSLKMLAGKEHRIATEQTWMIEGIQIALEAVKYYTNAASIATRKIRVISIELRQHPHNIDVYRVNRVLQETVGIAEYIERAIKHQEMMNEKLETALRVTTQATEQLTGGAKSTDAAALQLEHIVNQLTAVVGEEENTLYEQ